MPTRRAFAAMAAAGAALFPCASAAKETPPHPDFPFAALYRHEGRLLAFVAASHTANPASRTHELVNRLFDEHAFAAAIVEGVPSSLGASPAAIRANLETSSAPSAASWAMGEMGLTARRAVAANIPFWGGEPDQAQLNTVLLGEGYTKDDILSTLLLRRVPQMLRAGLVRSVGDPRLAAEFARMIEGDRRDFDPPAAFTLDDFYAWYRVQYGNDFVVEPDLPARLDYHAETRYARLQRRMSELRNQHLLRLIMTRLDADHTVIAVYGGSHFSALQSELTNRLGAPIFY